MFLLDTNIVAESRKIQQGKADVGLSEWVKQTPVQQMYLCAITLLELERGVMRMERKDTQQGVLLRRWLDEQVKPTFQGRILPFDEYAAAICAAMHTPDPKPITDSLIAAIAKQHNMTLITRNIADFAHTGVRLLNPFAAK